MKFRRTFVSNSSSASYTIMFPTTIEHVVNMLDEFETGFEAYQLIRLINDRLKGLHEMKKLQDEAEEEGDGTFPWMTDYRVRIEWYEELLEKVYISDQYERFQILCQIHNVDIDEGELNTTERLKFEFGTTMHNSYTEALPLFIQDMLLYMLFEEQISPYCTVEYKD